MNELWTEGLWVKWRMKISLDGQMLFIIKIWFLLVKSEIQISKWQTVGCLQVIMQQNISSCSYAHIFIWRSIGMWEWNVTEKNWNFSTFVAWKYSSKSGYCEFSYFQLFVTNLEIRKFHNKLHVHNNIVNILSLTDIKSMQNPRLSVYMYNVHVNSELVNT